MPTSIVAQTSTRWWPTAGTVILGGGHLSAETADDFIARLIDLAGGPEAGIVIIPTADPGLYRRPGQMVPASNPEDLRSWVESRGAHKVVVLHTRYSSTANMDSFAKMLLTSCGVFIPGGEASLLYYNYRGTLIESELKALLSRGGVIAGDAEGAAMLGWTRLSWLKENFGFAGDGFGFLRNVAVSPHANAPNFFSLHEEVLKYVVAHPATVGIDIDHDTMLIVNSRTAEVIGKGVVTIITADKDKTYHVKRLTAGAPHNLPL
jgi:cyanophycinase